jgi:hypothetical protein
MDGAAPPLTIGQERRRGERFVVSRLDGDGLRPDAAVGEKGGQRQYDGQDGRQVELRPHETVLSID